MQNKTIFIFGNPDLGYDSLPIKLIPQLKSAFPNISFELKDPNEEWEVPEDMTIIDTVINLKEVTIFNDLESFDATPRVSMHDFDALSNLRYLKKLGKLKSVKIIGVPKDINIKEALISVSRLITRIINF